MKKKADHCSEIRRKIQILIDHADKPDLLIHDHLDRCDDCKEYWNTLSTFGDRLREEMDHRIEAMGMQSIPNFDLPQKKYKIKKTRIKRHLFLWSSVAAALLIISLFFGEKLYSNYQYTVLIQNETKVFVDLLFKEPILSDTKYEVSTVTELDDWFEEPLFLLELMLSINNIK